MNTIKQPKLSTIQKQLARQSVGAKPRAKVRIIAGSAQSPLLGDSGIVWVGEHYWWGHLLAKLPATPR